MRIIRNNILPFKGFSAINLFGILFVRKNARLSEKTLNHERIHTAQIKEQLYAFFYLWYVIEWMIRLIRYRDSYKAYRNLSFEREAYANDRNLTYLENRKPFSFLKYL
jgi:hypothetical protein